LIHKKPSANRDNPVSIAPISAAAWPGIIKVQDEAYTGVAPESLEVLKSKWQASPQTCFVFQLPNNHIAGYLLAHPWDAPEPPKLFESHDPSSSGQGLYLHDLAASKHLRGLGVGKQLASTLLKSAKALRFKRVLLVAVQGSQGF
jgi:ribosomal protein S18 acetylase RimI-like enzyme